MAGDWIKMRADLGTHPKVVRISSALSAHRLHVIGGLHAVWCLFDAHSADGRLDGYTPDALDSLIDWPGFSAALVAVGWLEIGDGFLCVPRYLDHNGKSAKRRATEAQRKREERAQPVPNVSASNADKQRTREEKRRSNNPPTPQGGRFADFWAAWPANERKQDKAKCADTWRRHQLDAVADVILADVTTKKATRKWQEGFIEAPLVYLRNARWQDGATPETSPAVVLPAGVRMEH